MWHADKGETENQGGGHTADVLRRPHQRTHALGRQLHQNQ